MLSSLNLIASHHLITFNNPFFFIILEIDKLHGNSTTSIKHYFDKLLGRSLDRFYEKHPMIITSLLSLFLVTLLCTICLVFQFKYEKRKHLKWFKSQQQQKSKSRKSSSTYSNLNQENQDEDYIPVCNDINEDVDTIASIVGEDDHSPLVGKVKKVSRTRLMKILNNRFHEASKILQIQRNKSSNRNQKMCRTNSIPLPCEPFKHARCNDNEFFQPFASGDGNEILNYSEANKDKESKVTAAQVKKALASKTKRCRKGTYTPLRARPSPRPPTTSPVPMSSPDHHEIQQKRYSRSFSDLLSIIGLSENKTEKLLIRRVSKDSSGCKANNPNNNNVDSSNKTPFTTTKASIETIHRKQGGKHSSNKTEAHFYRKSVIFSRKDLRKMSNFL